MKRALFRAAEFLTRLVVSVANFGLLDALRVHFLYARRNARPPISIGLKPMDRRFYFRGASDRGVVSHFWTRGYRIREAPGSDPVRYIIDGGANIGSEAIRFRHFHPEAMVLAVEADAGNFEVLKLNAAGDPKIVPVNAALWSHEGTVVVERGQGNENFKVREPPSRGHPSSVSAVTVDALMHKFAFPQIDILKLDIEGAERAVFSGDLSSWLSRTRVLIFEPPDRDAPATTMQMFRQLIATWREFDCQVHGECIVLIRRDVNWALETDIFLSR